MKNNLVLLCLESNYSRNLGKQLADSLEMFFVDINDILEYNLVNNQMLESAGKNYFEKEKRKVICGFTEYENAIFCGNFELFSQNNNLESFKSNSTVIYLYLEKEVIESLQNKNDMQHPTFAFDAEDKFCRTNSDIVAYVSDDFNKSIKEIEQQLKNFYLKMENQK